MIDVKKIRKQLGMTQAQMAKACNCHVMTVSGWERKTIKPDGQAERLMDLLAALHADDLMGWYRERFIDQP